MTVLMICGDVLGGLDGPSITTVQLAEQMVRDGIRVTICCWCAQGPQRFEKNGVVYATFTGVGPKTYYRYRRLRKWLSCETTDVVLIQGAWLHAGVVAARWAKERQIPVVLTPHGCFNDAAMRRSWLKKAFAGVLYARRMWQMVDCFQALSESERAAVRGRFCGARVEVIANGVNTGAQCTEEEVRVVQKVLADRNAMLFLGRLDPIKGLPLLLEAWSRVDWQKQWVLCICGYGSAEYVLEIRDHIAKLRLEDQVVLVGRVEAGLKQAWLQESSCFVLTSHSEGLPTAPLEAMGAGLPVILTVECNLPDVALYGAGLEVASNLDSVVRAFEYVRSVEPAVLKAHGKRGRELVEQKFTWARSVASFRAIVRELAR